MFENLTDRLSQTLRAISGKAKLTEENIQDSLREVRRALLEADVALPVVQEFIDKVKFRGMVVPGDKLIVMARMRRLRKNVMVICEIQGYVEDRLVVDGEIKGVVLPATATQ